MRKLTAIALVVVAAACSSSSTKSSSTTRATTVPGQPSAAVCKTANAYMAAVDRWNALPQSERDKYNGGFTIGLGFDRWAKAHHLGLPPYGKTPDDWLRCP